MSFASLQEAFAVENLAQRLTLIGTTAALVGVSSSFVKIGRHLARRLFHRVNQPAIID
jgi:hypothetical protein